MDTTEATRDELVKILAEALEKHFEKKIHMARRLYPDVWKKDVAEVMLATYEASNEDSKTSDSLPSFFAPVPIAGTVEGSLCVVGSPVIDRELLARLLHERVFGLDDWGVANDEERGEMLSHADELISGLRAQDATEASALLKIAKLQETGLTIAALHEPKKLWESDRSYILICRTCNSPAPCPTLELARSIAA